MCGIAGYVGHSCPSPRRIQNTLELMRNRGPDVQDHLIHHANGVSVAFLHSRLSIIDLDARSNQPFTLEDCSLIFGGEIYNFVELRKELEGQGTRFQTTSDTEVLLRMYLRDGAACVERFEGMWHFAIHDRRKGIVFISRDRFGEKPLYYHEDRDGLFFGSEIKFLKSLSGGAFNVNHQQVLRYLVNGYKSLYKHNDTFFEGVRELDFGSNITVRYDGGTSVERYWRPAVLTQSMTLEDAVEGTRERLVDSVRLRMRSDVPLAFCLSGGVDSASLVSIASKILGCDVATFSIVDDDKRYDESANIAKTIKDLSCRNTVVRIPRGSAIERLRMLVSYHDAPLYTISYYVHSFLSQAIAEQGFRVVVSGTGADELLTGYYDHFVLHLCEMKSHPQHARLLEDWETHVKPLVRNPHLQNPNLYVENPGFRDHIYLNNREFAGYLHEDFEEAFTEATYDTGLLHNRMLNELFHEGTRVILHEDDLNSMQYSIENRSPFLDKRLFEFSYSIPLEHLIGQGYGKNVLRQAMAGILNEDVRVDRHKKGFNASIHSIIDLKGKEERAFLLEDGPIFDIVKRENIAKLLDRAPLPNSYSKFVFNFINAKIFLEAQIAEAQQRIPSALRTQI